jgi:penicillin amidase
MRLSVVLAAAACAAAAALACHRTAVSPPPLIAQVSGLIEVPGLGGEVSVIRDRYGIPHVYARSTNDLFVAQGFVQAQDRLFQMDLWRRSVQGRLSEVLGANFMERDAMTRRIQYCGDLRREWLSYGEDARTIAQAFVDGVNAWVALARARPPEAFVLAGWIPDYWQPDDLLNRTDAFNPEGGARAAISRKQFNDLVADAIRRVGTPPFFMLLAKPVSGGDHETARDRELVSPLAVVPASGSEVTAHAFRIETAESGRRYDHPAARYLIHLKAPGWDVAGATAPWRPGVAIGHNASLAWGLAPSERETQDVIEVPADAARFHVVKDALVVKGRTKPFEFESEFGPDGVVIAADRERSRKFILRWRGFDAGTAPELAALLIDRAVTEKQFDEAAARWQMPARRFVFMGREGQQGNEDREGQTGRERQITRENKDRTKRAFFEHPLAITAAARARFDIGPLPRPEHDQPFRAMFTSRDWDQSTVIVAPGQSESPDSPHFADMGRQWSAGEMVPLPFSDGAVQASSQSVLVLVPAKK